MTAYLPVSCSVYLLCFCWVHVVSPHLVWAGSTLRVNAQSVSRPWGKPAGVLQFRGNPTHTYYGEGPLPDRPVVQWRFPKGNTPMCSISYVAGEAKRWCGTGWTGQPVVWERGDGTTEVIFGAFDRRVHFLNAATGRRTRPDFPTDDIIKGSVTLDPDGYPLLYFGSRDNRFRVLGIDRPRARVLWSLHANSVDGIFDNDWDGNPSIVDGMLYEGGENSYLFAVELNRGYNRSGLVTVHPEIKVAMPGWTEALLEKVQDKNASIENSVVIFENRLYFANGAGRIVGIDISEVRNASPTNVHGGGRIVFDYWAGDDIDASLVVDEEGMLYAAIELERFLPRSDEVGQLIKLNPYTEPGGDPRVWGLAVPELPGDWRGGGIWSTPALAFGYLYVTTQSGKLLVVDRDTGQVMYSEDIHKHLWSSPSVIDDWLLFGTCTGELRAYGLTDAKMPQLRWTLKVGRGLCIESTPTVWKGQIFVGTWDGFFYGIGDAREEVAVGH